MPWGQTIPAAAQQQIVETICARNTSVDLHYMPTDGPTVRTKVRCLELSGETLVIDHPTVSGRIVPVSPGDMVRIYFAFEGQRYCLHTGWTTSRQAFCETPETGDVGKKHGGGKALVGRLGDGCWVGCQTARDQLWDVAAQRLDQSRHNTPCPFRSASIFPILVGPNFQRSGIDVFASYTSESFD